MIKEIRKVKCVDFTFDGQGLAKDETGRTVFLPSLSISRTVSMQSPSSRVIWRLIVPSGSSRIFVIFVEKILAFCFSMNENTLKTDV